MKLNATLLSIALLGLTGAAQATPSLQTCNPMEVVHNGNHGLSYLLACEAGGWKLTYSGSVPAGASEVVAKYRLSVAGARGEAFTQTRSVRLPTPNLLGQVLLREAVLLDDGDLALRDCDPLGCTQYRPLGGSKAGLTDATITASQEVIRLKAEVLRLGELSDARLSELTQARAELAEHKARVTSLRSDIARLLGEIDEVKSRAVAERLTLEGLVSQAREQRAAAQAQTGAPGRESADVRNKADVQALPLDGRFTESMDQLKELSSKYEALKLTHEDSVSKLDRAQTEAAMAAARLEASGLTQQLLNQNLAIANAELDATKHELAKLKRARATTDVADALASKDALLGRITAALVSANTQVTELKAELAAVKGAADRRAAKK